MRAMVRVRVKKVHPPATSEEYVPQRRADGTFINGRWKKGECGNPKNLGRNTAHLSTAYKRKLAERVPYDPKGRTYAEVIAEGMCVAAMGGKAIAAKEVRQATEGELIRTTVDWRQMLTDMGVDADAVMKEMVDYVGKGAS